MRRFRIGKILAAIAEASDQAIELLEVDGNNLDERAAIAANESSLALARCVGPSEIRLSKRTAAIRRTTVQRVPTTGPDEPRRQRARSHVAGFA